MSESRNRDGLPDSLRDLMRGGDHGSTTDAVTHVLREAIITGLLPANTWLREDEIAQKLVVSRTPVREALRMLSDEGLTQRVANRGSVVAPVTVDELVAVYAVREVLEGMAARNAALRRDPEFVARLDQVSRRMEATDPANASELARLNLEFHRLIRQSNGNPFVERFLQQVEYAARRFPLLAYSSQTTSVQALAEHRELADAIRAGDADRAERAAVAHMHRTREARLRLLTGHGAETS